MQKRPASKPSIASKVIDKIDVEERPAQRTIAKTRPISQSTVSRIIKSAGFALRKKRKVHKLTSDNVLNRRKRARGLYRRLANHRYKNFITTGDSWFYLHGIEGKRKVCYIKKTDPKYERMMIQQDSSRPKGFMVWGGISSCGETCLRFVRPGAKIDSDYYINNILKPFLSRDVPRLVRIRRTRKLILHQDSAPSHMCQKNLVFF